MPTSSTFKDDLVINLYNRLKACFGRSLSKQGAVDSTFVPSRVEQNLTWIPRNPVIEPLDLPPPDHPPLSLLGVPLQQRYSAFIAQVAQTPAPTADEPLREAGRQLARELLSQAITLGSSKGTEQSDEIYWLVQCAAIASLYADGAHSSAFAGYRRHVQYYQAFDGMAAQVAAFDRYVAADGHPVDVEKILSCSADERYRVVVSPWEAFHSQWVYSPRIIDTHLGTCLLRFKDARWSTDLSIWHSSTTVELVLRKYPGGQAIREVRAMIDCANRCARLASGGEVELTALERALDARLGGD
ncbi:hypothetical protein [Pseudomonas plecoglossicida]|uniref:hypothetical protein n=1 Tax=Pseudomonas plecoglossicida TaxID=70775 RepID=UPI003D209163